MPRTHPETLVPSILACDESLTRIPTSHELTTQACTLTRSPLRCNPVVASKNRLSITFALVEAMRHVSPSEKEQNLISPPTPVSMLPYSLPGCLFAKNFMMSSSTPFALILPEPRHPMETPSSILTTAPGMMESVAPSWMSMDLRTIHGLPGGVQVVSDVMSVSTYVASEPVA